MIETLAPGLRRAVSPLTGIVSSLDECLATTSDPRLFRAVCEVGRSSRLLGAPLDHLSGVGGAGRTRAEAAGAAVGEALERYSATFVPTDRLVAASARELGDAAVDPVRFALFSDRQHGLPGFPFRRFDESSRVNWVEGRSLPGGRQAFLPAELVFLGDATLSGERPIGYATSSGTACGEDRDDAAVRGLLEALERDAFMLVWTWRLSLPRLVPAGHPGIVELDSRYFAPAGLDYSAVDLSPFHGVPTVLGVVRARPGSGGALGVGAGTAPSIGRAWWKALAEAFAARSAGAKLALVRGGADQAPEAVASFEDHIRYYADDRNAGAAGFLDASPITRAAGAVAPLEGATSRDLLDALCRRVEAAGATAYAVDVTAPDVQTLGLTVVKVLAPELCPLDVAHSARFLGGARLYRAPGDLGLTGRACVEADVNADPHPFP